MKHLKYLRVIRNLNIVNALLKLNRYEDLKSDYLYLLQKRNYELLSPAVQYNISQLNEIINKANYGQAIEITQKIIAALEQRVFNFKCNKEWKNLLKTDSENVHFCVDCNRNIYKVKDEIEYQKRAKLGQCVFYTNKVQNIIVEKSCSVYVKDTVEFLGSPLTVEDLERHQTDELLPFSQGLDDLNNNEIF